MSDKKKKKKIDIRLTDDVFNEIVLVAWGTGRRRSELVREMIAYFCVSAEVMIHGQRLAWAEAVAFFEQKMVEENLSLEEITAASSVQTDDAAVLDMPDPLLEELELFAETYAESAIVAFKKHMDGRQNG